MPGMLDGIKVVDFTNYIPGPFATLRLAELGAEIVKVEAPAGDPARNTGEGHVFTAHNRGKKSIVLDLKQKKGREIALGLIESADVVVESFRPGVMEKFGLDYESLSASNPGLVYCSITGYGNRGAMSELGSHDLNYMSISGALAQLKDREGRPVHPTNTFADYIGGLTASERVLSALVSRFRTGKGSHHCISLADNLASMMANHVLIERETGYPNGVSVLNGTVVAYSLYETSDGRYISLAALEPKFWRNFCEAIGREDWIPAHLSKTEPGNPVFLELTNLFKRRSFKDWIRFGQQVDCCLAPVLEAGELSEFPYFKEKGFVFGQGQVKIHGDLKERAVSSPPEKGSGTEPILREWLAASEQQISAWKRDGIIHLGGTKGEMSV